jgi:hypothetical protein
VLNQLAARYSAANRRRKARRITAHITERGVASVLLVGAESAEFAWSNIVEDAVLASGARVVVSGLGPRLDFDAPRVFGDGRALPFRDGSFDLVISNAVIEHVGGADDQRAFVAEHERVGRSFIITTPNRWFPVESHTRTFLRHWSARWRDRQSRHFSRLLSRREFRKLLPAGTTISGTLVSPTFFAQYDAVRR